MHISSYLVRDRSPARPLTLDQRRALELVGRHDGRFGRARLAQVLAGEPDGRAIEFGLGGDALRGAVPSLARSLAALDALCEQGLIEVDATRGRYLVLRVTGAGSRRLGAARAEPERRVRRLDVAEQVRFDRLVARRDAMARECSALPSSIARLCELRAVACSAARDHAGLQRVLSPGTFSRFGDAACEVLAQVQ